MKKEKKWHRTELVENWKLKECGSGIIRHFDGVLLLVHVEETFLLLLLLVVVVVVCLFCFPNTSSSLSFSQRGAPIYLNQ